MASLTAGLSTPTATDLRNLPILHEWCESMVPLMEVNPDHSPFRVPLKQMFHQD